MNKVNIYTTETCFYCKELKNYLKENDIEFEEFDVSNDLEKRADMISKSSGFAVPVVDINNIIIVGFDKEKINKLLKLNE